MYSQLPAPLVLGDWIEQNGKPINTREASKTCLFVCAILVSTISLVRRECGAFELLVEFTRT